MAQQSLIDFPFHFRERQLRPVGHVRLGKLQLQEGEWQQESDECSWLFSWRQQVLRCACLSCCLAYMAAIDPDVFDSAYFDVDLGRGKHLIYFDRQSNSQYERCPRNHWCHITYVGYLGLLDREFEFGDKQAGFGTNDRGFDSLRGDALEKILNGSDEKLIFCITRSTDISTV